MTYKIMNKSDIAKVIPLFIDYYNNKEEGEWNEETVYKRIHQVFSREDSYCLIGEESGRTAGFTMGYFEQYDDGFAYDLIEIVIAAELQNKGLGTEFMKELEKREKTRVPCLSSFKPSTTNSTRTFTKNWDTETF